MDPGEVGPVIVVTPKWKLEQERNEVRKERRSRRRREDHARGSNEQGR